VCPQCVRWVAGNLLRMLVAVWVVCGVLGMLVLVVPTLRLWRLVKALGREVGRVSDQLVDASSQLDLAAQKLPTRRDTP
jgi:hypothetical protein